jgi:hypothetical protein
VRRDRRNWIRANHFARHAIHHVNVPGAIGVHQHPANAAFNQQIGEDVFVYAVVVVRVVRAELIEPHSLTRVGNSREDASGPLVITRTGICIPGTRVRRPESETARVTV